MNVLMSFILLFALSFASLAEEKKETVDHSLFSKQLKTFVSGSSVDYTKWKKEVKTLDKYLKLMAKIDVKKLAKDDQKAFYINVYNAWTIKLILKNGGAKLKSIKDIGKPWKKKIVQLKTGAISLDHLENKILRPTYKDPRLHFALNCGSKGCPDLWNQSYSGSNLDKELDAARSKFFNNAKKGVTVKKEKGFIYGHNYYVYVSKIFDWYDEDFEAETKTVMKYIQKHGTDKQKKFVKANNDDVSLEYFEYDWSLNGK